MNGAEDGPARFLTASRGVLAPEITAVYHFHVNLFAEPREESFVVSWEDAAAMLERMPRMIFELDGSFVLSGDLERAGASSPPSADCELTTISGAEDAPARWQVDGHLFDFAGRLHRVEPHGACPPAMFDELLHCVGWPQQRVAFEVVRLGATVEEAEFRRLASAGDALHRG